MREEREGWLVRYTEKNIVPFVFHFSDQPMRFRELMEAIRAYVQGDHLEDKVSGFRLSMRRTYLVFGIAWNLIILTIAMIFHFILVKVDCHALILSSIVFTILFFATFSIFKSVLYELVARRVIKEAWKNHFPHFEWDKHYKEVSRYYAEALDQEIKSKDLQLFIINKLVGADAHSDANKGAS